MAQEAYQNGTIGSAQLTLTDSDGMTYTGKTKPGESVLTMDGLPGSRHYEADVTA